MRANHLFVVVPVIALATVSMQACVGDAPILPTGPADAALPCTMCGAACVDTAGDNRHCGACNKACGAGTQCTAGACVATCPQGEVACGGTCVDTQTSRAHCGGCGAPCSAGQVCSTGVCALSCQSTLVNCGGTCVDGQTSRTNCGAKVDCAGANAGSACKAGEVCSAGACAASCGSSLLNCGGTCVDPQTSKTNCGASATCTGGTVGTACTATQLCIAGKCAYKESFASIVSPDETEGSTATSGQHFHDIDYALATPTPSTIHFTTDGTAPQPGVGTTKSQPSPVVLLAVPGAGAGTTIKWFADYGPNGGPELEKHAITVTTVAPGNDYGSITQHLKINGGGPAVVVAPGATVTGSIDFQAWASNASGYCPSCVVQWVVGVDGVGQIACDSYGGGPYPGHSANKPFTFVAPAQPGRYRIRQAMGLSNSCAQVGYPGGAEIGEVIVAN